MHENFNLVGGFRKNSVKVPCKTCQKSKITD